MGLSLQLERNQVGCRMRLHPTLHLLSTLRSLASLLSTFNLTSSAPIDPSADSCITFTAGLAGNFAASVNGCYSPDPEWLIHPDVPRGPA